MQPNRKLWQWLGLVFLLSFAALGWLGREIYLAAPPIPKAVVGAEGRVLFTGDDVQRGQQAWLSAGGQQLGTVWGHGSYVAPDWSADWLHREATALRATLGSDEAVQREMRRNTYDDARGTVTVSEARAQAIRETAKHIDQLFGSDPALDTLRDQYAMRDDALPAPADSHRTQSSPGGADAKTGGRWAEIRNARFRPGRASSTGWLGDPSLT